MQIVVTPKDIEELYRPLSPAEASIVPGLVRYAVTLLALDVPGLSARLDGDVELQDYVRAEIVFAIKRLLANPDFTRQISTTVDDGTVSRTLDQAVSAGVMYFPAEVLERLRGRRARGAFSIGPSW